MDLIRARGGGQKQMRVLWLNTWCLPHVTGESHIDQLATYISTEARRFSVDMIALGEVFGEATKRELVARLRHDGNGWMRCVEPPPGGWLMQDSGLLVLLAKGTQCHAVFFEAFHSYHLWDGLASKGFLGVDIETRTGERVLVVATHLQNAEVGFSLKMGRTVALQQLHQLLHRSWIWAKNQRIILVGDFNVDPVVAEASLSDGEVETFGVVRPLCGTTRDTNQIFDYAIASRDHIPPRVNVLMSKEDENPSDHFAILVCDETTPSVWLARVMGMCKSDGGRSYQHATTTMISIVLYSMYRVMTRSS